MRIAHSGASGKSVFMLQRTLNEKEPSESSDKFHQRMSARNIDDDNDPIRNDAKWSCTVCKRAFCDTPRWEMCKLVPCDHSICFDCIINTLTQSDAKANECPICHAEYETFTAIDVPTSPIVEPDAKEKHAGFVDLNLSNRFDITMPSDAEQTEAVSDLMRFFPEERTRLPHASNMRAQTVAEEQSLSDGDIHCDGFCASRVGLVRAELKKLTINRYGCRVFVELPDLEPWKAFLLDTDTSREMRLHFTQRITEHTLCHLRHDEDFICAEFRVPEEPEASDLTESLPVPYLAFDVNLKPFPGKSTVFLASLGANRHLVPDRPLSPLLPTVYRDLCANQIYFYDDSHRWIQQIFGPAHRPQLRKRWSIGEPDSTK